MSTVIITGGTGLIGRALTKSLLKTNHRVIILSRSPEREKPSNNNLSYAGWNIKTQMVDRDAISQADYIVHLAGAGVADKRWTKKRKQEIVDSRVQGGELIVKALTEIPNKVKAVVSASGVGWYGPDPVIPNPRPFIEENLAANDFLGNTCKLWEASLDPIRAMNKRLVIFRTGIVLSPDGGALNEFKKPVRFGFATILGNGKQIVSWIHIDDLVRLYIEAINNDQFNGVYNAVAPEPVSNRHLTLQLAKEKKGTFYFPVHVPTAMLKLVLGEMSIEVLKSATVSSRKVSDTGFVHKYPSIDKALKDLV